MKDVKKSSISRHDEDEAVNSDFEESVEGSASSESEADATASEDEDFNRKAISRGKATKKTSENKALWKAGAKLEPGTQVIIKKPKARPAGDTPYHDHTIHPNTMLFLKDLAANNDRQWLKCQ